MKAKLNLHCKVVGQPRRYVDGMSEVPDVPHFQRVITWKVEGKLKIRSFTLQSPQRGYLLGKTNVNTALLDCPPRLEELLFIYTAEICKVKGSHSELFLFVLEIF